MQIATKMKRNTNHACFFKLLLAEKVMRKSLKICMQIKHWASDDVWSMMHAGPWLSKEVQMCIHSMHNMDAQSGRRADESHLDVSASNAVLVVAAAASAWLMLCSTSLTFSCEHT